MTAVIVADHRLVAEVRSAVASVTDPEYPDVSIVDLGLLESIELADGHARIGLIPTFSGCPALDIIAVDVCRAVEAVADVASCQVDWLPGPVWTTERLTAAARHTLAEDYTVAVRVRTGTPACPVCGNDNIEHQSMAGPTRCRSVAWCASCRNPIEVMR